MRASLRRCLTSISTLIVSGTRLVRLNDIVSRPPENIRSTATAEPGVCCEVLDLVQNVTNKRTRNRKNVAHKAIQVGELGPSARPPLKRFAGIEVFPW
ncbi:hypothetical protein FPV67DRAFT_162146 [Lyophyllum atratum]|nr:hypothetical protein FPV67DRAFT_162146 [Lyophyllum atratum]